MAVRDDYGISLYVDSLNEHTFLGENLLRCWKPAVLLGIHRTPLTPFAMILAVASRASVRPQ
jgi:hypothetical protein